MPPPCSWTPMKRQTRRSGAMARREAGSGEPVGCRTQHITVVSPQIAEERKKTEVKEEAPESTAKPSKSSTSSQGPQTYRQGVGKYINMAAT